MKIHEILKIESPYLLKVLCKQYHIDEDKLQKSPGDFMDYYNYSREMVTDASDQRLNYGR